MIRVLIAEDSVVFQKVLTSFLSDEENIEIVGVVDNGLDAVEKCCELKPDLVTMDIFMPKMNGLEATRRIMARSPTRIVIISSMVNAVNLQYSFEAVQSGAVEVIEKPGNLVHGNYDKVKSELVAVLKKIMLAEPSKRFSWLVDKSENEAASMLPSSLPHSDEPEETSSSFTDEKAVPESTAPKDSPCPSASISSDFVPRVICIGGSTGAPAVLSDILRSVPDDFQVPIVVAQHIVKGFVEGMAEWLNSMVTLTVRTAVDGERPMPGHVLFAPDDMHIGFSDKRRIMLTPGSAQDLYVPSVNSLFLTAARTYKSSALGVVLSGMGRDGAAGLWEMHRSGAVTIAQNRETSVVYGMPDVAVSMGAVTVEMSPSEMIRLLAALNERVRKHPRSYTIV